MFTGDLADWGHPTDYPGAIAFLKETCEALGVPIERLFVVPGNHDINRKIQPASWAWMRKNIGSDPRAYSEWLAGGDLPAFRRNRRCEQVLERQQAFWGAVTAELGRPELAPGRSPHGRLGYRQTLNLPGLTQPIHVIALGKIADVLAARGEVDEALRIRREEELPVYERLGDVRSRAITLGQIADAVHRAA